MEAPTLEIDDLVYQKIMHWVNKSDFEVSGLGKIVQQDNGLFVVTEAVLLPQENTATSTDIEPEDVGKLMYELRDTPGELRWWWHSHGDMDVFWSGTDRKTIEDLAAPGWFLATVFNKKEEMRSALALGAPFNVLVDDIDTYVWRQHSKALTDQWDQDYDTNVENKKYTMYKGAGGPRVYYSPAMTDGMTWSEEYDAVQLALAKGKLP